jgi:DVNP family
MDMKVGSRAQVMHGTALKTAGGLRKADLKYNKAGRIVSRAKSARARKDKRLQKAGYHTRKGVFGHVKKGGDE